jgi:hypothetical protein
LTNRGYGVFFDHTEAVSLEIQNEKLANVQASVQGEQIRWYIIHGPSPREVSAEILLVINGMVLIIADPQKLYTVDRSSAAASSVVVWSLALNVIPNRLFGRRRHYAARANKIRKHSYDRPPL